MKQFSKKTAIAAIALISNARRGDGGMTKEQVEAMVQGMIAKNGGDASRTVSILYEETYNLREKVRTKDSEIAELKKQIPTAGTIVLTDEDAKAYEAYKALGSVKDVKAKMESAAANEAKLNDLVKGEVVKQAAELTGFKESVLRTLSQGMEIEIKEFDTMVDGKPTKVSKAFIKDGEKSAQIALDEFAAQKWNEFMPSLKAEGQGPGNEQKPAGFAPYLPQGQGGTGTGNVDPVAAFRKNADEARSKQGTDLLSAGTPK